MKYTMTTPCSNCPFLKSGGVMLRPSRVAEIDHALIRSDFPCHQTVNYDKRDSDKEAHCAGALIMMEKMGRPSQLMRIFERLGMYDASKLNMDAPVFDDFEEMMEAQTMK
jgi:hypothetical protein